MERYDDAVTLLNDMIEKGIELGSEGRNLLSAAYKSALNVRRYAWRVLAACEAKPHATEKEKRMAREYRKTVDTEYRNTCNTLIRMLDELLIPKATEPETKVYLLKMKADYYRYLAEITIDNSKARTLHMAAISILAFAEKSMSAYNEAMEIANDNIPATHPLRMGLALNYAVYYYEIVKDVKKACTVAEQAYSDARPELLHGAEENKEKRDSLLILQLLQENLTKWMAVGGLELNTGKN
uniref:14_3_3 domain-containing protein n=1 Tax=Syphacia muris TaxID=451379 RepID=A0A0N5ATH5_9BILA